MNSKLSAKITLLCSRLLCIVIGVLFFTLPKIMAFFQKIHPLIWQARLAVLFGFYCCVPIILYALWCIDRLVGNILKDLVFVTDNIRFLRRIRWCCAGVGGICLGSGLLYPPLLFLAMIMAFLALTVSVVKNVMAAAVEIREENDLTV